MCNSLTGSFLIPFGLRGLLDGAGRLAVPEHAQARRQFQWKPIAGYLIAGTGDQRVDLKIA
ncbi:hypothetical protein D7003_12440 [Arthrobacter oryzae]|uniref:Uncharacterized protein n=1 Tax=Arthrobacter oryzae TaxID=409290 RepID=A0A3N0BV50_9MICC|nr:hypothetical protein D7003_12440 [Arthrobacter oryzae]